MGCAPQGPAEGSARAALQVCLPLPDPSLSALGKGTKWEENAGQPRRDSGPRSPRPEVEFTRRCGWTVRLEQTPGHLFIHRTPSFRGTPSNRSRWEWHVICLGTWGKGGGGDTHEAQRNVENHSAQGGLAPASPCARYPLCETNRRTPTQRTSVSPTQRRPSFRLRFNTLPLNHC